jgi:flavin reductase (DIM6/NTAB) family NADH-FMN oxidoreductase RutF
VKSFLALLRNGRGLRHLPVVYSDLSAVTVRVVVRGLPGGPIDVSADHCPVSLRPLILGLRLESTAVQPSALAPPLSLEMSEANTGGILLARIGLKRAGAVPLARGTLQLFETEGCDNWCAPSLTRWYRYALAWQHARRATRRGDGLRMSARDLRALNAYYIVARPVYLVGVAHEDRVNLFPMDLVGAVSSGEFLLALRATSPAIALMEASRRIAMSGAPAVHLRAIYALGAQHHKSTVDLNGLTFPVARSMLYGLPVLAQDGLVRELSVQQIHRIGSHVLFVSRVDREAGRTEEQLAHVSGMYAERLSRKKHPLRSLA